MDLLENGYDNLAAIADNPRYYANLGTAAVGASAGFVVNSIPKEVMDKTGKTEKWSSAKRLLGGNTAAAGQTMGLDHYFEDMSSWFKAGYVAGGGATYALPHKESLNELMEYWDALLRTDRI